MIDDIRAKYDAVKAYEKAHQHDNGLSNIWLDNMPLLLRIIREAKSAEHLIDCIDRTFCYAINYPPELSAHTGTFWRTDMPDAPEIRAKAVEWLAEVADIGVVGEESQYVHYRNRVPYGNCVVSVNYLRTLAVRDSILDGIFAATRSPSIIELGAGAGHQARTMLTFVTSKYTIVDLPETLCFSYAHLRLCFPDKSALFVTCPEDIGKIDSHDLVFVPACFSHLLAGREYDLFLNVASLGEMPNKMIRHWLDFVQNKISVKYLFTLNRFMNTVTELTAERRTNENECMMHFDHRWRVLDWEVEPIYCRCPWIDTMHNRYVQFLAARDETPLPSPEIESMRLYQDAISEDWYRLRMLYGGGATLAGDNVLVNDMGVTGTTFKLWQSIRLHPTRDNVTAILMHLNRLSRGRPFEEEWYYERLLASLPVTGTPTLTMG